MADQIPKPAVARLCSLYQLLRGFVHDGVTRVSSTELGRRLGIGPHNLRKDISYLGVTGNGGGAYSVDALKALLEGGLCLGVRRNICVVGLGRLGSAILEHAHLVSSEFVIAAGFDSNVNLLETIRTSVPVFPAGDIERVVREKSIALGIVAVSPPGAQEVTDRLGRGGVRGILNFASVVVKPPCEGVFVRNIDIVSELRYLSALLCLGQGAGAGAPAGPGDA